MVFIAPERDSVFIIRMAPKMMAISSPLPRNPVNVYATACVKLSFHTNTAMTNASSQVSGMAFLAGHLKATIRTITSAIGIKAIRASMNISFRKRREAV